MLVLQRSVGNAAVARAVRGRAGHLAIQRTLVNTNGGVFDNGPMYNAVSGTGAVGERVGANIMVDFTPGDLVETPVDGVGLIQTVRGVTDRVPGGATLHPTRDQGDTGVSTNPDEAGLVAPNGAAVDISVHPGGRDEPTNSPIYGMGFQAPMAGPAATLQDDQPALGRSRRGSHVKDPVTGAFSPPVSARMEDGPGRIVQVAGQTFEMNFEIAALVTSGPMENTYLGSGEWGWQSDATGNVTLKPFVALASGAPTAAFMQASGQWNASIFHDDSFWGVLLGETADTVDIPITTLPSGVKAAADMTTAEILSRVPVVQAEIRSLAAGPGVDRTNKEFEMRALVTELGKRKLRLGLDCHSISDTGGAASPPEDEVWLALSGGSGGLGMTLTSTKTYRAGDSHTYEFALTDFLPLTSPLHIEVNEHDRAGSSAPAHDDVLIATDFATPFARQVNADSGGHYTLTIDFDK
jgi:hypothetical protein